MNVVTENMDSTLYKRIVPWFSMDEWKLVYNLVYSESHEDQKCGLNRLVGWKARCQSLPPAVECTLCIFQVLIEDPDHLSEKCVSVAIEQQLRLMYSTAVMRFLNLMLEVPNQEDLRGSMYSKAENLGIPEWIVNLRHDAAHGVSLPDLSLLRAASVFISKWLHEYYWEQESQIVSDWHVTPAVVYTLSADERELRSIIESWEALSLYDLAGFENMSQIPDNDLKSSVKSIHEMLKQGNKQEVEVTVRRSKVSTALSLVLRKLVRFFKSRSGTMDKASLLADIVVGGDFLLPSESLMQILKPSGSEQGILLELPPELSKCCSDFMNTLWTLGAIPALVLKLISFSMSPTQTDIRRSVAALWVQKVLASCVKVREARKVRLAIRDKLDFKDIAQHYKSSLPGESRNAVLTALAFAAVENQRPDLKVGYSWKVSQIPSVLTSMDLIRQAVFPPSKFSSFYLPCAMELVTPRMAIQSRMQLMDLINNYSNDESDILEYSEGEISSVSEFINRVADKDKNSPSTQLSMTEPKQKSAWSLSQCHLEWGKSPLGVLPWQREQAKYSSVPESFMLGKWNSAPEKKETACEENCSNDLSSIHRIKAGRVMKTYVKTMTPKKVLKTRSASPNQRAIKFVSSLYQNNFVSHKH